MVRSLVDLRDVELKLCIRDGWSAATSLTKPESDRYDKSVTGSSAQILAFEPADQPVIL